MTQAVALKNLIRQARLLRGLTQAQLAERVGTTAATVSRLEKNAMTVSTEWLERFAKVLGVHPADLIERPERPSIKLIGKAGRSGRIGPGGNEDVLLDLPSADAVGIEVVAPQGPYAAGERLIGERLTGPSMVSGAGRDCIIGLKDGAMMLARLVGTGPKFTLVPLESRGAILYDQAVEWIAPLVMRVQYLT